MPNSSENCSYISFNNNLLLSYTSKAERESQDLWSRSLLKYVKAPKNSLFPVTLFFSRCFFSFLGGKKVFGSGTHQTHSLTSPWRKARKTWSRFICEQSYLSNSTYFTCKAWLSQSKLTFSAYLCSCLPLKMRCILLKGQKKTFFRILKFSTFLTDKW